MIKTNSPVPKATTAEVANHFRVSLRTVQNWRDAGMIPFLQINSRNIRYDLAEVERALQQK